MKRLAFLIGGAAALALSACSGNNQPAAEDLNALANEAATNAEDAALGNQQQELNEQNAAAPDNGPNPSEAEEQNVSGM